MKRGCSTRRFSARWFVVALAIVATLATGGCGLLESDDEPSTNGTAAPTTGSAGSAESPATEGQGATSNDVADGTGDIAASDDSQWVTFTPDDGSFSIDFPGEPTLLAAERVLPSSDGTPQQVNVSSYRFEVSEASGYALTREIYPDGAELELQDARLTNIQSVEMRTINGNECEFTIATETFTDAQVDGETKDVDTTIHYLACLTTNTSFIAIVIDEGSIPEADSARFFDSFEIR